MSFSQMLGADRTNWIGLWVTILGIRFPGLCDAWLENKGTEIIVRTDNRKLPPDRLGDEAVGLYGHPSFIKRLRGHDTSDWAYQMPPDLVGFTSIIYDKLYKDGGRPQLDPDQQTELRAALLDLLDIILGEQRTAAGGKDGTGDTTRPRRRTKGARRTTRLQ